MMVIRGVFSSLRIFGLSLFLSGFSVFLSFSQDLHGLLWSECRWLCDMNINVVLKCRRDVTVCMNFLELKCGWQCDMDVMIT